jgi:hypothetical protein
VGYNVDSYWVRAISLTKYSQAHHRFSFLVIVTGESAA